VHARNEPPKDKDLQEERKVCCTTGSTIVSLLQLDERLIMTDIKFIQDIAIACGRSKKRDDRFKETSPKGFQNRLILFLLHSASS